MASGQPGQQAGSRSQDSAYVAAASSSSTTTSPNERARAASTPSRSSPLRHSPAALSPQDVEMELEPEHEASAAASASHAAWSADELSGELRRAVASRASLGAAGRSGSTSVGSRAASPSPLAQSHSAADDMLPAPPPPAHTAAPLVAPAAVSQPLDMGMASLRIGARAGGRVSDPASLTSSRSSSFGGPSASLRASITTPPAQLPHTIADAGRTRTARRESGGQSDNEGELQHTCKEALS